MKTLLLTLLCHAALCAACAAGEPFIPGELNELLPKLHAGMTDQEVRTVLARVYPNVKDWGGTGFMNGTYKRYSLDGRFALTLCFIVGRKSWILSDPMACSIDDIAHKRRWDIKPFDYGHPAK